MPRFWMPICVLLGLAALGCGGRSSDQDNADDTVRQIVSTGRSFIEFFEGHLENCGQFLEIEAALAETPFSCDNAGQFQLKKLGSSCSDTPSFKAQANFELSMSACADELHDTVASGILDLNLSFSTSGNQVLIQSQAFTVNGRSVVVQDFVIDVEFSSNRLDCEEASDLLIAGESCDVSNDCQSCDL